MKVALVHHWLVRMRGGEKVLEGIAELFPDADVFTLIYRPRGVSEALRARRITASWLNRLPLASRLYPALLPFFPLACASLNLGGYDLVISSDASIVKGVTVPRGAVHVCMCYSPPRYLWGMSDVYLDSANILTRLVARACIPRLRAWDYAAAQKISYFVADSENVQARIKRYYGRESTVIYPPVATVPPPPDTHRGDHYLVVGQLVPYKRTDLAVLAAGALGRRLVVIGEGPEMQRLKKLAGPTVDFLGWQSDAVLRRHMASCRALLFPGEEDFGIVPVEAQMAGCPVIAFRKGGALETVVDGRTGVFFDFQESECMAEAILRFEAMEATFSREDIRRNALRFRKEVFMEKFGEFVRRIDVPDRKDASAASC